MDLMQIVWYWELANMLGLFVLVWYQHLPYTTNKVGLEDLNRLGKGFLIVYFFPTVLIAVGVVIVWELLSALMLKSERGEVE